MISEPAGKVIALSSRRPHRGHIEVGTDRGRAAAVARRQSPTVVLVVICAFVLVVVGAAIGQWRAVDRLAELPVGVRRDVYGRTLADVRETCVRPEAANGLLRDHCMSQARFLVILPECDQVCRGLVESILPRTRR